MATKRWIGNAQDIAEVKTCQITAYDAATTYKLTINGKVISTIAAGSVNATATALETAWNASTDPEVAEITADSSTDTVTLTHDTAGVPFTVTSSVSGGTGTIGAVSTTTSATGKNFWSNTANWDTGSIPVTGVNEVQSLTESGTISGGTWTITFNAATTSALQWDANAATVQAALEALATIGTGNITVTGGSIDSAPFILTFKRDLGGQNVSQVTVNTGSLTGSTPGITVATDTAGSAGDDVVFDHGDIDVKYALDQSSIILNSLTIYASYTGSIGLPKINSDSSADYIEYRDDYLKIGVTPGTIAVGGGTGNASGRIKINTGSQFSVLDVKKTASATDTDVPALLFKGTDAYNEMTVRGDASVGVAVYGGESATLTSVKLDGNATAVLGAGCTLTTVTQQGSDLEMWAGCTTLTQTQGETRVEAGAVTTLNQSGGTVIYNSTGALGTPTLSESAVLDFSQDPRSKTCGTIDLHGPSCSVLDPEKVVASLVVDCNYGASPSQVVWGPNSRLTRTATS